MAMDPQLGDPFQVYAFDAGNLNQFHSTLVRYPFVVDNITPRKPKASVLYVHGFNDYFFQKDLAQKIDSAGYAFFALDLHKYGRSLRKGERVGEVFHITEYFPELDSAIAMIRKMEDAPVVLLGHSTGGLILSLYANERNHGKDFAALVLNSPFLDMNMGFLAEKIVFPFLSFLGKYFPSVEIPRSDNPYYGESLHKEYRGEWEFSLELKRMLSLPINFAWARAIHLGHLQVQNDVNIQVPVLVMHSNCSIDEDEWVEEFTHCDAVLDFEDIQKYGARLGSKVTVVEVQDGLHDLYLSRRAARESAYKATFDFLDGLFK